MIVEPLNIPYEDFWCTIKQDKFSKYHKRVYSQHYQDGIIERIFGIIKKTNKFYVEFGARDGLGMSNTANLRENCGWTGVLFDSEFRRNTVINLHRKLVSPENINLLFNEYKVPHDFDFLSIDIDGYDYWVWKALTYEPRVVQIEASMGFSPLVSRVPRYNKKKGNPHKGEGASVSALKKLGESKGYSLVYRQRHDLFFVKTELLNKEDVNIPLEKIYSGPYESSCSQRRSNFTDV